MPTIFGRDRELGELRELVDAAVAGRAGMALVVGEAGVGKSRLVDEVALQAAEMGLAVVRGEAFADDRAPFGLWRRTWPPLLPHGAAVEETFDAEDARWGLVDEVRSAVEALGPAVLVLEDVHWADDPSVWLLDRLAAVVRHAPLVLLATVRTAGGVPEHLLTLARSARVVVLEGLDLTAVAELLGEVAPGTAARAAEVWTATGGNPLLVRELATAPAADVGVPRGAVALLQSGFAALGRDHLRVVQALALVEPHRAPATVLAHALDLDPRTIADAVDTALRLDLLRRRDDGLRFRHDLLAQAAVAPMSDGDRRDLHGALAAGWSRQRRSLEQRAEVARHRMAALPMFDYEGAFEAALDAMAAARAAGRTDVLVDVGQAAWRAATGGGLVHSDAAVQVLVELGEALHEVGDVIGSAAACARAADLAGDDVPAMLAARAEVGASRDSSPFVPDTARMARLAAVEARIPSGDNPLRATILARLGVLGVALPGGIVAAHRQGDEAVAMARRLGDPELLVNVLTDRYLAPLGPDDLTARAETADEIVAVGTRLRRPDVALLGLDWRFQDRLDVGDRTGAELALGQLDVLAAVMPSPRWRYTAALRRVGSSTVAGHREEALDALGRARELAPVAAGVLEATGLELAARIAIARLWETADPAIEELYRRLFAIADGIPAPFIQIQLASIEASRGDVERAHVVVERFGPSLESLMGAVAGLVAAHLVADLAAELGAADHAPAMGRALAPYVDRIGVGNGVVVPTPIAATVGRLALLAGDVDGASAALRQALDLAERAASPVLSSLCRRLLATVPRRVVPGAGRAADGVGTASILQDGPVWRITSTLGDAVVSHMQGVEQLARLVVLPHTPIDALGLAGGASAGVRSGDLGGMLDARAKREYRRRVTDLRADIDEAEQHNDPGRAEAAQAELDAVLQELSRAVGLGGRDRPSGATAERARVSVTRSLRRAIAAIAETAPVLGAHLDRSVRTGRDCLYDPEPAAELRWVVHIG